MVKQKIRATAEKTLVERSDGFVVLRARLTSGETVRVTGRLQELTLGAEYEWLGSFELHPSFGRQFHADSAVMVMPTSELGIERFLASGRFKGIGPKTAQKIVAHFGLRTLDILKDRPEDIALVKGLSKAVVKKAVVALGEQQDLARLGSFLRGHDVPAHVVDKLVQVYGSAVTALTIVQESPYQIVDDVFGVGFKTADTIARAIGIAHDAQERIAAALQHVLQVAQEEGHMCLPMGEWTRRASLLLAVPETDVAVIATRIAARTGVVIEDIGLSDVAVYHPYMHKVEKEIATHLLRMAMTMPKPLQDFKEGACDTQSTDISLSDEQESAARSVLTHSLVIMTGGPGTGKTTTVRRIVSLCAMQNLHVVLAAPTGRAAKRLAQSTGCQAVTLHRLLEVGKLTHGGFGFSRNNKHPLDGDVFIIDEASMIDAPLFFHLLDALPQHARLLLVGDPEQLPSVGPGAILSDVMQSGIFTVHELSLVFRQEKHSDILLAAHAVRKGIVPTITHGGSSDYFFIQEEDPQKASELIEDLVARRLPAYLSVRAIEGIQVLTPMRKGYCGVDRLNERLTERLSDQGIACFHVGHRVFHEQDKVMHSKNDYDRELYNGDMGIVVDASGDELVVQFGFDEHDVREERFGKGECAALVHAFAISVHKSQGSEYPCVVIPLLREHAVMLHRHLLYTAMTRAKNLLVIVGSAQALEWAVRKEKSGIRYTGLMHRLQANR